MFRKTFSWNVKFNGTYALNSETFFMLERVLTSTISFLYKDGNNSTNVASTATCFDTRMENNLQTSRNPFFKGKPPTCQLMYGRCVVCLGGGTPASPSWGGGVPQLVHQEGGTPAGPSRGGPLLCSLLGGGGHFHVHFWKGGPLPCSLLGRSTSVLTSGGGPLPCSLLEGGSTSMFTSGEVHFCVDFWGGVHFHVHFWGGGPLLCSLLGGSTSMFTSGGSHWTYPIMLLYTTIEFPSASWAKFTWDPPPPTKSWADWQTNTCENITFPHYVAGGN